MNPKPKGLRPSLIPSTAAPPPPKYYPGQIEAERLEIEKKRLKQEQEKSDGGLPWWLFFLR